MKPIDYTTLPPEAIAEEMMLNKELLKPLAEKEIQFDDFYIKNHPKLIPVRKRVLFLDPTHLYEKVTHKINPAKRHQGIQMDDIFPKVIGSCACGCEVMPKGGKNKTSDWQRKWATDECQSFANDVLSIMNNYFGKPAYYIDLYYGHKCSECPETKTLELDHIVGVKHGGGACWLSNYVWRCKSCHTKKTNKDFNKGEFKNPEQTKLFVVPPTPSSPK